MWQRIEKDFPPAQVRNYLLANIFSKDFIMCSFKVDEDNIINVFPLKDFAGLPDSTILNVKHLNLYKNQSN